MAAAGKRCIELDRPVPSAREWSLHCWPLRATTTAAQRPRATAIRISPSRTLRDSMQAAPDMRQKRSYEQTTGCTKQLMSQQWRTL